MPQSPRAILEWMRSTDPASPRLVWHGRDGRIELSGRVFDNWVAKSSHLLVDELDAVQGTEVRFDLPVHWKSLALAFACWQIGAVVVVDDAPRPRDAGRPPGPRIVLSSAPGGPRPQGILVCVDLAPLSFAWDGELPRGAVDFAAEVRAQDGVFLDAVSDAAAEKAPLVLAGGRTWTAEELLADLPPALDTAALDAAPTIGRNVTLLEPGSSLVRALAGAYAVWLRDGTLVLVAEGVPVSDRLLAGERVTGRL